MRHTCQYSLRFCRCLLTVCRICPSPVAKRSWISRNNPIDMVDRDNPLVSEQLISDVENLDNVWSIRGCTLMLSVFSSDDWKFPGACQCSNPSCQMFEDYHLDHFWQHKASWQWAHHLEWRYVPSLSSVLDFEYCLGFTSGKMQILLGTVICL